MTGTSNPTAATAWDDASPPADAHRDGRRDVMWAVLVGAVLMVPLVVAGVLLATGAGHYRPGFDNALIELRARDAFSHLIYTGPYSRFGWYHPGPMLFYLLAVPYHLAGERSIAIPIAALGLNAVAIGALLWIAFRIGRLPGVLWCVIPVALLMRSLGIGLLHSPWNPDVSIFAFFTFLVAAWAVADGQRVMLVVAAIFGSFVVQSHVGDALPVVLILVVAIAFGEGWRPHAPGRRAPVSIAAGLVVFALWALPLYGDVVAGNGNLRKVAGFAISGGTSSDEATAGGLAGLEVVGAQWGTRPLWLVTSAQDLPFEGSISYHDTRWWLPVSILPAAGLTLWALLRRRRTILALGAIVGVGFVTAIFTMASVRGIVWSYLSWWTWVLGAATGVLTLAGIWALVAPRWERIARTVLLAVASVVVVAVAVDLVVDVSGARVPSDSTGLTVAQQQAMGGVISEQVLATVRRGTGPVVLDTTHGSFETPGLALALERAGIPARVVGADAAIPYGAGRHWTCGRARARLAVFSGDDNIKFYKPKGRRIARWVVDYTPAERRHQVLTRQAFLAQPESTPRANMLQQLNSELDGPKYDVEVFDQGPVDTQCRI